MTKSIKFRRNNLATALLLICVVQMQSFAQAPANDSLSVRDIMSEPSIAGMRAEGEKLSPDGKWVAYLWSAASKEPRDLYLVSTSGDVPILIERAVDTPDEARPDQKESNETNRTDDKAEARAAQRNSAQEARERSVTSIDWSPDSRRILFSKRGDLYIRNIDDPKAVSRRLTRTIAVEGDARWLADSRRVLYRSSGNLFVVDVDQTSIVQLTREGGGAAVRRDDDPTSQQNNTISSSTTNISVSAAQPSDDGQLISYIVSDNTKQRALVVPNYIGEFVTAPTFRRGWSMQRVQIVKSDGSSSIALVAKLPEQDGVGYIRSVRWTPDSKALIVDRIDRDTKRRQIYLVNAMDGASKLIDEEKDAKWIAPLSRIVEVSPKGDRLLFASERGGYNHLFMIALPVADKQKPASNIPLVRQLTVGEWEVNWAKWLPTDDRIIYSSTEGSTSERHFYILNLQTNKSVRMEHRPGMDVDPQLAKSYAADGSLTWLYEHSEWNMPSDLFSMSVFVQAPKPFSIPIIKRLTNTVPSRFSQIKWTQPTFVEFRAKDGKLVKARVYSPRRSDVSTKYPAVVFVHGAGYLQNVINGWNNYYREAMFNHILVQQGYVVLDIDYRGSAGYGRDWRTDVHDFLGGTDFQDHLDGIDFIIKNYAVDPARVGMYGGSYGGFMAEMAVMRAPEKVACAAALRPVADWKNYYASSPVYTTERLGFPDKNAEAYKRSSPITYASQLRSPLLILHGMVDDNVHFQDSAQLIEKLIELGKTEYFETMFYPTENHGFVKPESWTDEYERILRFFNRHLRRDSAKSR